MVVVYVNDGPAQKRTLGSAALVRRAGAQPRRQRRAGALGGTGRRRCRPRPALALGEVYRHNGEWKFKVLGQGYAKGIAGIAADYGITL